MHRFIPAMASIASPNIAEIKVRHHARSYGTSKYGLSRVYKVLLDLLTIKTLTGFFSQPTIWFSILGLPFALLGLIMIGGGLLDLATNGRMSIPLAGTGLLFLTLAVFLFFNGVLGELVYRTGDTKYKDFVNITRVDTQDRHGPASNRDFPKQ